MPVMHISLLSEAWNINIDHITAAWLTIWDLRWPLCFSTEKHSNTMLLKMNQMFKMAYGTVTNALL